jgi:hypothetical protein
MNEHLGKDSAMVILASLALATLAGLVAWGPLPIAPTEHQHADLRTLLGIPSALNVLVNLPCFALCAWGWRAMRASLWPADLRRTWQWFQVFGMLTALSATAYHLRPGNGLFAATHVCMAGAFTLLTFAFLAERVSPWFASTQALAVAVALPLAMGGLVVAHTVFGSSADMRPLLLLELIPILLVPTGAIGLRGAWTQRSDWMFTLGLYVAARSFEFSDRAVFEATGWISGHTLSHLCFGAVGGWAGYCATRPSTLPAAADGATQRQTSLNTAG